MILVITLRDPDRLELQIQSDHSSPRTLALMAPPPAAGPRRSAARRLVGLVLRWTGGATIFAGAAAMALLFMPASRPGAQAGASPLASMSAEDATNGAPAETPSEMPTALRAALSAPPVVTTPADSPSGPSPSTEDPLKAFGLER